MSLGEYELGLVNDAKKGKKKSLDRLFDALHKELCDVVEGELGDRSRAETIIRSVSDITKAEVKRLEHPEMFEQMVISLTVRECKKYPVSQGSFGNVGASQFAAYENAGANPEPQNNNIPNNNINPGNISAEPDSNPTSAQNNIVNKPLSAVQPEQPAEPVKEMEPRSSDEPVVAWLVCIKGADRGTNFAVRDKINIVGSLPYNDIQIHNDANVAPQTHACIVYDRDSDVCLLYPGAVGTVCLNGKFNGFARPLKSFDVVTLGNSMFVYAPVKEGLDWRSKFGL